MKDHPFINNLPPDFAFPVDPVGRRLLAEYGAVFVARGGAVPPRTVVFEDERAVSSFQNSVPVTAARIGDLTIELQSPAMSALREAVSNAAGENLTITPRGADAARRSYAGTVENWASRVEPGLLFWVEKGSLNPAEAERIRRLSPVEQIPVILGLEERGLFFAKTKDKTIIYSVAPPGTSQHLSMLALDVEQYAEPRVRELLADSGWFQTVPTDLPHFTYLGVEENQLAGLGLKKVVDGDRRAFWVPDL